MKKLSPKDLLSNFVEEITERMSEQEQSYKDRIAELELENKKYHSRNKELSKDLNELKIRSSSVLECLKTREKQLERYNNLLKLTPGNRDNKVELLEHFTETIIPAITEKIESKYTSKIIEFMNNLVIDEEEEEEEIEEVISPSKIYYVYSHTMAGKDYPYYIGYSANNDNNYKRSKDFSGRSYDWYEYVIKNGGTSNIIVSILEEINSEKAARELEKNYIKYYSEFLVNKAHIPK